MRITGPSGSIVPRHIAQAYGVKPAAAPARTDAPAKNLVAGTVSQPPTFETTSATQTNALNGALQLYTRAADKIEAAVAVQVGRTIDLRG